MKKRDLAIDRFTDVKNVDEPPLVPGQYVPLDFALYNPCGLPDGSGGMP